MSMTETEYQRLIQAVNSRSLFTVRATIDSIMSANKIDSDRQLLGVDGAKWLAENHPNFIPLSAAEMAMIDNNRAIDAIKAYRERTQNDYSREDPITGIRYPGCSLRLAKCLVDVYRATR